MKVAPAPVISAATLSPAAVWPVAAPSAEAAGAVLSAPLQAARDRAIAVATSATRTFMLVLR